MDIWVLNKNLERVGIIDGYKSLIWSTRYAEVGDFELYLAASDYVLELVKEGFYLVRDQDVSGDRYNNVMIAENFEITTDIEEGDYLIITGKDLKSIVKRRVVINQTIMNGQVQACIQRLLNENIIAPSDTKRKINNFTFVNNANISGTMSMQATGDNLGDLITEICTTYGLGYDIYIKGKKFYFTLTKGVDRSLDQTVNPHVIFSYEFDNLLSSDYKVDNDSYANVALVAGEGEGLNRKKTTTGNTSATGLQRYEVFVDAKDISSNDGAITNAEYIKMLAEKGNEKLAELQTVVTFDGEVDATRNYILNRDFYLGDIVQIINEYGISKKTRITEIIESEDENGASVIPTFAGL